MQKYKIVGKSIVYNDGSRVATLYRIKALRDIPRHGVKAGDLGGWIAGDWNLSHDGDCWVKDKAIVEGDALVTGDAIVKRNAWVAQNAIISDSATVGGKTTVSGYVRIFENATVEGLIEVYGCAKIYGRAIVSIHSDTAAWIFGCCKIFGNARVLTYVRIYENAMIYDNAVIAGRGSEFSGDIKLHEDAYYTQENWHRLIAGDITGQCAEWDDLDNYSIKCS